MTVIKLDDGQKTLLDTLQNNIRRAEKRLQYAREAYSRYLQNIHKVEENLCTGYENREVAVLSEDKGYVIIKRRCE